MAINPDRWRLKLGTEEGIPDGLRPTVWLILSAGKKVEIKDTQQTAEGNNEGASCMNDIEASLERRAPKEDEKIISGARGILQSIGNNTDWSLGYPPGLCDIVIRLIKILGSNAAKDTMLSVVMPQIKGIYVGDLGSTYVTLLKELMEENEPELFKRLSSCELPAGSGTDVWSHLFLPMFQGLFYRQLCCAEVEDKCWVRLMDLIVCDSNRILLSCSIALLLTLKGSILEAEFPTEGEIFLSMVNSEISKLNKWDLLAKALHVHSDKNWLNDTIFKEYLSAKQGGGENAQAIPTEASKGKCTVC